MSEFDPRSTTDRKDNELDGIIRPQELDDFTGQREIVSNLEIYIKAAKMRGDALDHTLFHGPPGLGKTTLAHIIANEMGVNMKVTSGPVLDKPGDLAGLLTSLEKGGCTVLYTPSLSISRAHIPCVVNTIVVATLYASCERAVVSPAMPSILPCPTLK